METTKQRHFSLLAALENRYGSVARAPGGETLLLDKLLRDHDWQVARFTAEMGALKAADPQAHLAVLAYMREINIALARYAADASGSSTLS